MKAARFGSPKYSGGSSVGLVATCQKMNTPASSASCQKRNAPLLTLLLRIAFQHLGLHRMPDLGVQFQVARREPHLGHVARPRQVDAVVADRASLGPRRQ